MTVTDTNPDVTSFLDGDSIADTHQHDDLSDLQNALDALAEAYPLYEEAEQYYNGHVPEFFASGRLRRALARAGDPYKINFAKKPVDLIAEKLTITSVSVPDNPDADAALQAVWERNRMDIQHKDILRRACEFGDANVIVWPALDRDGGVVSVDMFYNDPATTRVFYDTENPLVPVMAVKKWVLRDRIRVNLYYPDRIEKYVSEVGRIHNITASELKRYYDDDNDLGDDGEEWPLPNPYDLLPMFHLRNQDPYGVPEHADFYGVQNILTKLIIGHMSTADYATAPQRYALADPDVDRGDPEDDEFGIDLGGDEDGAADDPKSQLSADPGALWFLQGVRQVGQFDVADPRGFLDPMLVYLRFGAQIKNLPLNRIDPTGAPQSGDSRRIMNEPFNEMVRDRRKRYGAVIQDMCEAALKMLGHEAVTVVVTWAPLETVEDMDGWSIVRAKIEAGMPPREAFLQAGCTEAQVDEWFPEEGDVSWLLARADILLKLGQALQALGAASAFQLIEPAALRGLVDTLLADLDERASAETGLEPGTPSAAAIGGAPLPTQDPAPRGAGGDRRDRADQPE